MEQINIDVDKNEVDVLKEKVANLERHVTAKSKGDAVIELLENNATAANSFLIKKTDHGYIIKELVLPDKALRQF